jgi:SsrA-binding protein
MSAAGKERAGDRVLASNREAGHLYHLGERLEAGLVLLGTEVKAIREGRVNLRESWIVLRGEQAYLVGCNIGAYTHTGYATHEPTRERKLLLHKRELRKLQGKLTLRGLTLVPIKLYSKGRRLKLEVALGEGKKLHDKREAKRAKEAEREVRRHLKDASR